MTRKRAIVLHGMPDEDEYLGGAGPTASNNHWLPWLQKQLQLAGHDAQTPEVVDAYKPQYGLWAEEFERHLVDEPMMLVGHSCGAGFLARWLSQHPEVGVDTLILVAPWLDPQREHTTDFFDFEIDPHLPERIRNFSIFNSSDDSESIQHSVSTLRQTWPGVEVREFAGMGHFCRRDMGTDAFPELLSAVLR